MPINIQEAIDEFRQLKVAEQERNYEYYLNRQAVKGNFLWPRDWPVYIGRVKHNLCKPITERFVTYLLGKGFSWNIDRPNSAEYRESAERSEKILRRLLRLSDAELQLDMGARTGSQLGRSIFKVYEKGKEGNKHACFTYCQPDYFYGITSGDNILGDYSVVYYSYSLDQLEARRLFGPGDYKTQDEMDRELYEPIPEAQKDPTQVTKRRRIPVLECWTKENYALVVGGVKKFNGETPYKRTSTGEGFIPFVVIENIRNAGEGFGEADISQSRMLNEMYNQLISRKNHIVGRWLQPTLVWEGAPQNYAEILTSTIGGGGAIPTRLGSRLYFLAYDRPNPAVQELELTLRAAILETAGMSEIALQGTVTGSVNTGPALETQMQPVLSTIDKKQKEWEAGLKRLFDYLLEVQENIGDSGVLGQAVINQTQASENMPDGELVQLSGTDIQGLREVTISWPGVLPKDSTDAARLEMEKATQGLQSLYTTLEKLGEEYPADELARIRIENEDKALRGDKVAEQMRAQAPIMRAENEEARTQAEIAQMGDEELSPDEEDPEAALLDGGDLGARLRSLARNRRPTLDDSEEELAISTPAATEGY